MKIGDLVEYRSDDMRPHGCKTGIVVAEIPCLPPLYTVSWWLQGGEVYTCSEWPHDLTIISKGDNNANR
jgi:hypothetical protein